MSDSTLQQHLDEVLDASAQQWILRGLTMMGPVGAVLATTAANDRWWPLGLVLVALLSAVSAIRPDSELPLGVVVVVGWHWLATVDGFDTPWLPVAAVCLLVYHAVIALAASLPTGGAFPVSTLRLWSGRTALVAASTVAMWGLVVVFGRRDADGNALLTAIALALAAGGALAIRVRSVSPDRGE